MHRATALIAAFAAFIAAPAIAATEPAQPDGATVTFDLNVGATTGKVMIVLFDSEAAYDADRAPVRAAQVDIAAGERAAVFEGLPAGDYAAKSFHDVDGDGEMDTNPFGMPTEPYAFSNNAVGNMGPAGWDRAHFTVSGPVTQTLNLSR